MPLKTEARPTLGRRAVAALVPGTIAFALAGAWAVLDKDVTGSGDAIPYQLGFAGRLAAAVLVITGVTALHRVQKPWTTGIAKTGYGLIVFGLVLFAVVFSSFWVLGWLVFHLGAFLFGVGVVQARVLSRWGGWLLVATPIVFGGGVLLDRALGARGGPAAFAGTAAALIGLLLLASSEARRLR